jgi:hypothetical protein
LISCISRSAVSQGTNGSVGRGITKGDGRADGIGEGLVSGGEAAGSDVTEGLGLNMAAIGGGAPVVQAASKAAENAPDRRLESLMSAELRRTRICYEVP